MRTFGSLNWLLLAAVPILAQDLPPRIEIGLHLATIDESGLDEKPLGGGGGVTYRLTRFVAADTEVNRYPIGGGAANFPMTQFLLGARAGIRFGNIGLFGKIRPGFAHYDSTLYAPGIGTKVNLDVGGIIEFYSRSHIGARLDFGNTVIFFGNNPIGSPTGLRTLGTRNQFQGSFGAFGHF